MNPLNTNHLPQILQQKQEPPSYSALSKPHSFDSMVSAAVATASIFHSQMPHSCEYLDLRNPIRTTNGFNPPLHSKRLPKKAYTCATDTPTKEKLPFTGQWEPRPQISEVDGNYRMWANEQKAIKEHPYPGCLTCKSYLLLNQAYLHQPQQQKKLTCTIFDPHQEAGHRETIEDAHFYNVLDNGNVLAGIFDGHNGSVVANYCAIKFKNKFCDHLIKQQNSIYNVFEQVFDELYKETSKLPFAKTCGCTAVVTFVDLSKKYVYTATLGDCEATIYRKILNVLTAIPISCVRNWGSKRDSERAFKNMPHLKEQWKDLLPKKRRVPSKIGNLNVSRTIGDTKLEEFITPTFSHKPKSTMLGLLENDLIILSCDGLKDYVTEPEIINQLELTDPSAYPLIAKKLVLYTVNEKKGHDNVTILAMKVTAS